MGDFNVTLMKDFNINLLSSDTKPEVSEFFDNLIDLD